MVTIQVSEQPKKRYVWIARNNGYTYIIMQSLWLKMKNSRRVLAGLSIVGLLALPAVANAAPATTTKDATKTTTKAATPQQAAVNQAYGITGNVQQGMLVMLDPKNTKNVTPLTNKNPVTIQGVVVAANESAVSLSGDGSTSQVYVATNGQYNVLVSTQNGSIAVGDILSISALDGIAMKADADESVILGKALAVFDGRNNVSSTTELTSSTGTKFKVAIGIVKVDIGISHNPLAQTGTDSKVPSFLRKLAQSIAGKPVDAARIYLSIGLLLATIVIAGSLLLGGVRSSLISVGRNPLAKNSVLRGMVQVLFVGMVVFILGLAAIYLLLKA